jgi:hypothetical protein
MATPKSNEDLRQEVMEQLLTHMKNELDLGGAANVALVKTVAEAYATVAGVPKPRSGVVG